MVYIRQQHLANLKNYKYASADHSPISRFVLKPFYNKFVINCFPMSMACITLTGFMFVVLNFITVMWFNPNLDTDCPRWVYASCAIGLFLYQTFDAVDGMQARRTRQSGPLGELFDHSVDACNTGLGVLVFASAMNLGQGWMTFIALFGSTMTFYVQTWDEYYTQILTLGFVSGPVEGILALCTVYGVTAYMGGGSFWHQSMLATIGVPKPSFLPNLLYDMPFTQGYLVYGAFVLFFATGSSIMHVMQVRRERGQDPFQPLYGLLPLVAIWTLTPAYLYLQPAILENFTIPFGLFVTLVNAYSVGRIIVGHLTQTSFPYQNVLLYPLALGVLDSAGALIGLWSTPVLGNGVGQVAFTFVCLGLAVGVSMSSPRYVTISISGALPSSTHSPKRLNTRMVRPRRPNRGVNGANPNSGERQKFNLDHHGRSSTESRRVSTDTMSIDLANDRFHHLIRITQGHRHQRHLINYLADRLSLVKMVLAVDLLNPTPQAEGRKHKLKTLVPQPRSFFMDVKCPGCFTITTVFSHAQTVVICAGCSTVLCQPTGGKARLTEGCSFRRK
ncbi:unnamed protein product [Penicillium salamii]|nr:unnamed protein product [Penicillium salamii]